MAQPNDSGASSAGTTIGIILVVLLAVIAGAYFMNASKHGNSKLEEATEEFRDNAEHGRVLTGIREGSEDLQDRSTGEKVGDAIEDAGRDIQDAANDHK